MPKFIYDQLGNPVGYINKDFIHTLHGQAIGQLNGNNVHKMNGEYVGQLDMDIVVDTNIYEPERIGHRGDPGNPGYYGIPENRGSAKIEFVEVFRGLLDRVNYIDEAVNNHKQKML